MGSELTAELAVGDDVQMAASVRPMDKPAVSDYLYNMMVAPSSGDLALGRVLKPGAFAKQPLADRLPAAVAPSPSSSSSSSSSSTSTARPPVILAYGVNDWMDSGAGAAMAAAINARGGAACSMRVKGAGHQLSIDNTAGFKECMEAAMSFPTGEAGQAARQQWKQHVGSTHKQLILDT